MTNPINFINFIKILRIFNNSDFLSKRSNMMLNLVFDDKIVTRTKGQLRSTRSICTFKKDFGITTEYHVHPNFVIPEEYLEFPKLYIIYQNYKAKHPFDTPSGNVRYYRFGPSSRLACFPYGFGENAEENIKNNLHEVEFHEDWYNEKGQCHRDGDYSSFNYKNGEVVGMACFVNGEGQNLHNNFPHRIVRYLKDVKELYEKTYDVMNPDLTIFQELSAAKIHVAGTDRWKRRSVYVRGTQVTFTFGFDEEHTLEFNITDDPGFDMRIGTKEIFEMIEDFGNPDPDGLDMSDRFILDYLALNPIQEEIDNDD